MSSSPTKSAAASCSSSSSSRNDPSFQTRHDDTSETSASAAADMADARPPRDSDPLQLSPFVRLPQQSQQNPEAACVQTMPPNTNSDSDSSSNMHKNMALDHVDDEQQGGSMLNDHDLAINLQADLNGEVTLKEAKPQAESSMLTTAVCKAKVWNSDIKTLDTANDEKQGGSTLDDHALAIKLQADLNGELTLKEGKLQAESMLTTSLGKAKVWHSVIKVLDHVDNDQQGGSILNDHDLAIKLQATLDGEISLQEARLQAERSMLVTTSVGKAWKFVEQVLCVHDVIQASPLSSSCGDQTMDKNKIATVAVDDMVYMVERLLTAQECFRTSNKPTHVDIGYHYTTTANMDQIQTDGLLTRSERENFQIQTRFHGDSLGDGVYTGNNPFAFHKFKQGDVGILVARLRGHTGTRTDQEGVDTAVKKNGTFSETVVTYSSYQCVALVSFSSSLIQQKETTPGSDLIHKYHCELQAVVDEIFNEGKTTVVPKVPPEDEYVLNRRQMRGTSAPATIGSQANNAVVPYLAPAGAAVGARAIPALVPLPAGLPEAAFTNHGSRLVLNPNRMRGVFARGSSTNSVFASGINAQTTIAVPPLPSEDSYELDGRPAQLPGYSPSNRRQLRYKPESTPGVSVISIVTPPAILIQANDDAAPYLLMAGAAVGARVIPDSIPPLPDGPDGPVQSQSSRSLVSEVILYTAPDAFNACHTPSIFGEPARTQSTCSVCLDGAWASTGAVSLTVCGHEFHQTCVGTALQYSRQCPVCRKWVGNKPQGAMPTGTMEICRDPTKTCSGCEPGAIIINYSLGCNVQKAYHPNPGTPHGSASRRAFLPDNRDGQNLLKRLKYAFRHGLTFCVGTSLTTGVPNVITWSSIHHKTSLTRGPHGFPDLGYFINSNEELDSLSVPAPDNL